MRVDIYPINEDKILKAAHQFGISPTQLVNEVIENVNIILKVEIEKVDMTFTKAKLEAKETCPKLKEKEVRR